MSVDAATGEATTAIVSATPARLFEGTIYDITVDPGEPGGGDETTISATGEHPFLVARAGPHAAALDTRADPEAVALVEPLDTRDRTGQDLAGHGRWVPASDLAEGDAVRTMSPQGVAGTATVRRSALATRSRPSTTSPSEAPAATSSARAGWWCTTRVAGRHHGPTATSLSTSQRIASSTS